MPRKTASGSKVMIVADNAEVMRVSDVKKMAKEIGQAATARQLGLTEGYISRVVRQGVKK